MSKSHSSIYFSRVKVAPLSFISVLYLFFTRPRHKKKMAFRLLSSSVFLFGGLSSQTVGYNATGVMPLMTDEYYSTNLYSTCKVSDLEKITGHSKSTGVARGSESSDPIITCEDEDTRSSRALKKVCRVTCGPGFYLDDTDRYVHKAKTTSEQQLFLSRKPFVKYECSKLYSWVQEDSPAYVWTYRKGDLANKFLSCKRNACPLGIALWHKDMKHFKNRNSSEIEKIKPFHWETEKAVRRRGVLKLTSELVQNKVRNQIEIFKDQMTQPNYATNGWTIILEFNQTIQTKGLVEVHKATNIATSMKGQMVSFTSFKEPGDRDLLTSADPLKTVYVNFRFAEATPAFDVVGVYLVEGRFGSLQCHFDYDSGYDEAIQVRQDRKDMGPLEAVNNHFDEEGTDLLK